MSEKARMGRAAALLAGLLLIVAGTLLVRAEIAWLRAVSFRAEGDYQGAVRAARGVFDLYVPGNPRLDDASALLWEIAEAQEAQGDQAAAIETLRVLRSAWIGAHPAAGDGEWIARSEARIARLGAGAQGERERAMLARMQVPRRPFGIWGGVAALGFACWVWATIGLISRGFMPNGKPRMAGLGWAVFLALGYATWMVGMMRA